MIKRLYFLSLLGLHELIQCLIHTFETIIYDRQFNISCTLRLGLPLGYTHFTKKKTLRLLKYDRYYRTK